jgi:hypothetical protein
MSSAVQDIKSTFQGITKDITSVFSLMIIFAVLMIVLPILLQVNKLIQSLGGFAGVAPVQPMAGFQSSPTPKMIKIRVLPKP